MVRTPDPQRRARFLSAALKLFVANGVQNTSTAEIAKEAGSAAGTLFLYFPTKQDLIHELTLKIGREQSEYIKSLLDAPLSVRDTFFTIWTGSIRWILKNLDAFRFIQQVRDSGVLAASVVQESARFFDYYYQTILRGHQEGLIKAYPIDMIGGFLYQDIAAMMNLIAVQTDAASRDALIQAGFDIFWDGIKK